MSVLLERAPSRTSATVIWMARHPRPKPPAIKRPDPALLHAGVALASLALACVLGLWLASAKMSIGTLKLHLKNYQPGTQLSARRFTRPTS